MNGTRTSTLWNGRYKLLFSPRWSTSHSAVNAATGFRRTVDAKTLIHTIPVGQAKTKRDAVVAVEYAIDKVLAQKTDADCPAQTQ
jgi:hypothetical protein